MTPRQGELVQSSWSAGVRDRHYETVATALLWTLQQGLGKAFTTDVREAWATAYGVLATTMKDPAKLAA
jgi:hemoglobin-like flavoprotein